MVRLGPYKEIFEAHRDSFSAAGYSADESSALAQAIVARPIPESYLGQGQSQGKYATAVYYESAIPSAMLLLEFNQYEAVSLKIQEACHLQQDLFRNDNDPRLVTVIVSGVYPGNPGTAVVKVEETGSWFATDWSITDDGDVKLDNVRDIGAYYETLAVGVTEALLPALNLETYSRDLPLQVESAYLTALAIDNPFEVPAVVIDGPRPVAEMEFVKYLRSAKAITESFSNPYQLQERKMTGKVTSGPGASPVVQLAVVTHRRAVIERAYINAMLAMNAPLAGVGLLEKSTTLQSVVIDKAKFSESEASAMGKRNHWGSDRQDSNDSYRLRQFDPSECVEGSYRTITLKEGVSGVICKRKGSTKTEAFQRKLKRALKVPDFLLHEAGDMKLTQALHHLPAT
jgi:hypothetical protein